MPADSNKTHAKLLCDWSKENKFSFPYRRIKNLVKPGIKDEKVHEVKVFEQKNWLVSFFS